MNNISKEALKVDELLLQSISRNELIFQEIEAEYCRVNLISDYVKKTFGEATENYTQAKTILKEAIQSLQQVPLLEALLIFHQHAKHVQYASHKMWITLQLFCQIRDRFQAEGWDKSPVLDLNQDLALHKAISTFHHPLFQYNDQERKILEKLAYQVINKYPQLLPYFVGEYESLDDLAEGFLKTRIRSVENQSQDSEQIANAAYDRIKRYPELYRLLLTLPATDKEELLSGFIPWLIDDIHTTRILNLLEIFLSSHGSQNIYNAQLLTNEINCPSGLFESFDQPVIWKLVSILADYPERYGYQLGLLFSILPRKHIPKETLEKLHPIYSEKEVPILTVYDTWSLCTESEKYLLKDLKQGSFVVIGGGLVWKATQKKTAYCFQTVVTDEGIFVAGNWYSPVSPKLKSAIEAAYDRGVPEIDFPDGNWVIQRPLRQYLENDANISLLITYLREIMRNLPHKLPSYIDVNNELHSRAQYRKLKHEEHT